MQVEAIVHRNPQYRLTLVMDEEEAAALHYLLMEDRCTPRGMDADVAKAVREEIEAMLHTKEG